MKYGNIKQVKVASGKSGCNYGFVEFAESSHVEAAVQGGQVHEEDSKGRSHMIGDNQVIVRIKDPVRERVMDKMKQVCGIRIWISCLLESVCQTESKLPPDVSDGFSVQLLSDFFFTPILWVLDVFKMCDSSKNHGQVRAADFSSALDECQYCHVPVSWVFCYLAW